MFKNYLKIALRNLLKHKGYSLINILGLAIGITCCLLIMLFVADELSYDRFHEKADSIYRLNWDFKWSNQEGVGPGTPPPLAAALVNEIPEIEAATRIFPVADMITRSADKAFNQSGILGVDANFFRVFGFKLLEGDPQTVLSQPNSVVLTEETAHKYFGNTPAVGKTLVIGEDKLIFDRSYSSVFTVTGIVQNPPHNSHIQFEMLTSMASHPEVAFFDWSWIWMQMATYAVVREGASLTALEAKIAEVVQQRAPGSLERVGLSYNNIIANGGRWSFVFQPLADIYLGSVNIGNRLGPLGNRIYVYVFTVIAVLILSIACINFMNLSTARAAGRAKEVGIRKVLGSFRSRLIGQFLSESLLFSVIAMFFALGMTELLLPFFNYISGKTLELHFFEPAWLPLLLVALIIFVGLAAGYYPGLYLSSFKPVEVLKGRAAAGLRSRNLRYALVIFQFVISISLIICTLLVHKQLQYVRHKDLGFDKENILVISNENERLGNQAALYKEIIKNNSLVENATVSTGVPPEWGFQDYYKIEGKESETFDLISYMTDEDFLVTLGIEIVEGRGFSKDFSTEAASVILNESAVKQYGWEEAIGKKITYPGSGEFRVIGVMKDFNFATLHSPVLPFALFHSASKSYQIPASYIIVRLKPGDLESAITILKAEWNAIVPGIPFEYSFLDDNLDSQYRAEKRLSKIFLVFSGLAIFVACLGLLGLASFTAEARTKEIGIRKVLGASVGGIVGMLSKEFTRWVLFANLIAWPLAWYAMNLWLENFAYRIEIGWWEFVLAGALALVIALLTVGYQAVKAALSNPVESLRYE